MLRGLSVHQKPVIRLLVQLAGTMGNRLPARFARQWSCAA